MVQLPSAHLVVHEVEKTVDVVLPRAHHHALRRVVYQRAPLGELHPRLRHLEPLELLPVRLQLRLVHLSVPGRLEFDPVLLAHPSPPPLGALAHHRRRLPPAPHLHRRHQAHHPVCAALGGQAVERWASASADGIHEGSEGLPPGLAPARHEGAFPPDGAHCVPVHALLGEQARGERHLVHARVLAGPVLAPHEVLRALRGGVRRR
mmetsp:Transcript_12937/g.36649  ORF Transcript_12937/g.36649 Transcript_12937/m.36649 type:complete len:206 (+) Transcript_12937:457-1074(+)